MRVRQDLLSSCECVELGFAEVISRAGDRIRDVYFPTGSFISLVTELGASEELEVGIIGDEGMLGSSLILGVDISPQDALVQGAGAAWRMSTAAFRRHCDLSAPLRGELLRYVYVLMRQLAQATGCIHYHLVEARLARWLLMTRDRAHRDQFRLTHKFLALMLGVQRVGITLAAGSLQERGLISYSRGVIDIVDGGGLERASCRCYQRDNAMYRQVLGGKH
jgi:CRP-like cAMP-binding protein